MVLSNTSAGAAAPVCSIGLRLGDTATTPSFKMSPVQSEGQPRRWRLDLHAYIGAPRLAPATVNVTVTCADGTETAPARTTTTASWRFTLGTCADSGADECIASSVTNRACAYCGGQCVPFPQPYAVNTTHNGTTRTTVVVDPFMSLCTRCGDGLVMPGEQCEMASSRHCSPHCKCIEGSYPVGNRCRSSEGIAAVLVRSLGPLEVKYQTAKKVAAAIASKCLAGVLAQTNCDVKDVVLAQDDVHPRIMLRVGELPLSPTTMDYDTPSSLLRAVSGACVNSTAAAEGLQARWGYYVADAGCGDGVVSGAEHCDSTEYCSPISCRCQAGARPIRVNRTAYTGNCTGEPLYVSIRYSGSIVTADVAHKIAGQLASRCFDDGEVALVDAVPSATHPAIRVLFVPAGLRYPGKC
eukprot:m51a1_g10388 hypothetical protein (410) ;mRNA; r:14517-16088